MAQTANFTNLLYSFISIISAKKFKNGSAYHQLSKVTERLKPMLTKLLAYQLRLLSLETQPELPS